MFPLKKSNITLTDSEDKVLHEYKESTEIPVKPHPGSFGQERKNHIHQGVDIYCEKGDEVFSIEDGMVIKIKQFTGEAVGSPWWNDTWCILIEGESGVFNYGEITVNKNLTEGAEVKMGQVIGNVETILKKDKGRPMNMLRLELYIHGTKDAIEDWQLGEVKPQQLLDPTDILQQLASLNKSINKSNKLK